MLDIGRYYRTFLCKGFWGFCLFVLAFFGLCFTGGVSGFFNCCFVGFFKVWLRLKISLLKRSDLNASRLFNVLSLKSSLKKFSKIKSTLKILYEQSVGWKLHFKKKKSE